MKPFELTLKNDKLKQYDRIGLFIIIINLALFIYMAITTDFTLIKISSIAGILFIIILLTIDFLLIKVKQKKDSHFKIIAEYIAAFTWFQIGFWWMGIAIALLGALHFISKRQLLVSIVKEKISYPSFPKKNLAWAELNNIVLKDGLLTIDLKNNHFIQQAIDETKTSVNEQEFNDFCREQLNK